MTAAPDHSASAGALAARPPLDDADLIAMQRAVTDNLAEGVVVAHGPERSIIYASARMAELLGYGRDDLLGRPLETILAGGERTPAETAAEIVASLERDRAWNGDVATVRRDGGRFTCWAHFFTLQNPRLGAVWCGALIDVTEQRETVAELQRARRQADAANAAKTDYLSRMSHELRTPLAAILGFADLLRMESLDPSMQRRFTDHIVRAAEHLSAMVEELLEISRIEAGREELTLEPVALRPVIEEACALVLTAAQERGTGVRAEAVSGDHHVVADAQRLKQVLVNLLSNAVKYGDTAGAVEVTVAAVPGRVRVAVRDDGPGIEPELLDRVFQPFDRLGAERTAVPGTGLGLALSKRLVEAMGGTISVESAVGEGTTFTVELPVAEAAHREPAAAAEEAPPEVSGGAVESGPRTVLYVEDNLANLQLVEELVARRPDLRLITCTQGETALELIRTHRPSVVICDLHLPDIDGDEVLRRIRADPAIARIPVMMLSADASPRQVDRLIELGARAYLTKPLRVRHFYETLELLLASSV